MADSALIRNNGVLEMTFPDTSTGGAWGSDSPSVDTDLMGSLSVSFDGQTAYVRSIFTDGMKYPYKNAGGDIVVAFVLDKSIPMRTSGVTVSAPPGLVTEGSNYTGSVTALAVTNNSTQCEYASDSKVGELIDLTGYTGILYVSSTGTGGSVLTPLEGVLDYARDPDDSDCYATGQAAVLAIPGTGGKYAILFKSDDNIPFNSANMNLKGGFDVENPLIFAAYGTGDKPVLGEGNTTHCVRMREEPNIHFKGLAFSNDGANQAIITAAHNANMDLKGVQFSDCEFFECTNGVFNGTISATSEPNALQGLTFTNCMFYNCASRNTVGTAATDSDIWREISFIDCLFHDVGQGTSLDHWLYIKAVNDLLILDCQFYTSTGAVKVDYPRSSHIEGCVTHDGEVGFYLSSNGFSGGGADLSVYRDSCIINCVNTQTTGAECMKVEACSNTMVRNNILVRSILGGNCLNFFQGSSFPSSSGDTDGLTFQDNTFYSSAVGKNCVDARVGNDGDFDRDNTSFINNIFECEGTAHVVEYDEDISTSISDGDIANETWVDNRFIGGDIYENGSTISIATFETELTGSSGNSATAVTYTDTSKTVQQYISDRAASVAAFVALIQAEMRKSSGVDEQYFAPAICDYVRSGWVVSSAGPGVGTVIPPTGPTSSGVYRKPLLVSGNISYTLGEPDYDDGDDLIAVTGNTDDYYGYGNTLRYIRAATGVRMAITADSQFSGGPDRGLMGILQMWPFPWSAVPAPSASALDPWYYARQSSGAPDTQDWMIDSQWHNNTTTSNGGGVTVAQMLSNSGLGDPSQIPMQFTWLKAANPMSFTNLFTFSAGRATTASTMFYDANNFSDSSGIYMRMHAAIVCGGGTDMNDGGGSIDLAVRVYHNEPGVGTYNFDSADTTVPSSGSTKITLNSTNGDAALQMFDSGVFQMGAASTGTSPSMLIREDGTSFDDKEVLLLNGYVQRYTDASTPEDNIGIYLTRAGAGRNPECFLYGADNGNAALLNFSGDAQTRAWMWRNYGQPNVLVYSFGHNSPDRDVTLDGADSQFQADLADLIYQDCEDVRGVNGEYPKVLIMIPWVAGSLDDTRMGEMLGIVDAVQSWGIDCDALNAYNYYGGSTFNSAFTLDGSSTHPGNESACETAYDGYWDILDEGADTLTEPSTGVQRSGTSRMLAAGLLYKKPKNR